MSIVALKNLSFWGKPTPSSPCRAAAERTAGLSQQKPFDTQSSHVSTDLEAQAGLFREEEEGNEGNDDGGSSSGRSRWRVNARVISDATIGLSDGLTVPFALTAGLSALDDTRIVIFGGLAELIAGSISMGLGGYLGAKSEAASYRETRAETERQVSSDPAAAAADVRRVFAPFAVPAATLDDLAGHLAASPRLADFLMQFRHGAQPPVASRALTSALTIALGYFLGGLLPLIPYFCVGTDGRLYTGLYVSIGVMAFALFVFGYAKTCVVVGWRGPRCVRQGLLGALQMMVVGGAAAAAAWGLVRGFNSFIHDGGAGGGN